MSCLRLEVVAEGVETGVFEHKARQATELCEIRWYDQSPRAPSH
jgi:hypothetical protein